MPISIARPKPPGQKGLRRPFGDGNVWTFRVLPEAGIIWVEGPNWSYPGKGAGADPDWGQWGGGDGQLWLSWISPQKAEVFTIKITGKIGKAGGTGGGKPIDVEASWEGLVEKKTWKPEPEIDIKGGVIVMPQNQQFTPPAPIPVLVGSGQSVLCAVTDAVDKDTWTLGEKSGEDAGTIKYEWTTSGGGFVTAEHPLGDAPKAETQNATWKAPAEPGDYTLSCRIDDAPKAIPENEAGDRDDAALPSRVVQVKVVKVEFDPATLHFRIGQEKDVTATVTPDDVSDLITFETEDTSIATVDGSAPELTLTAVAADTTKLQAIYRYGDPATKVILVEMTVNVRSLDDPDLNHNGDPDITDPDDNSNGVLDEDEPNAKIWNRGTGISGAQLIAPLKSKVRVPPGSTLACEVAPAFDNDRWRQGEATGEAADTIKPYVWQAIGGGSVVTDLNDSHRATYTAPMQEGTYTVQCLIDDEGVVPTGEYGKRGDSTRTVTILVEVANACKIVLTADNIKSSSAHLTWNPCEDEDFTSYTLHRPTEEDFTSTEATRLIAITDRNQTEYQDTGLSPDTDYFYVLVAIHAGQTTGSRTSLTTKPFDVTFEGNARACAGGVAVDSVHDFTLIATAKDDDGNVMPNVALKFSFEGNKGEVKRARYVPDITKGQAIVDGNKQEEMTATTDAKGKVGVHVLGSDKISDDIKLVAKWKNIPDEEKEVGDEACEFVPVLNYRRFGIVGEEGDSGWKFDDDLLFDGRGDKSPAKFWPKIQKDTNVLIDTQYFEKDGVTPRQPNDWGNWEDVNGHKLNVEIGEIVL